MKSVFLDPVIPFELARRMNDVLRYNWPVEYRRLPNGVLIAEDIMIHPEAGIPCPSLDMTVRYLLERAGYIVEPNYKNTEWGFSIYKSGEEKPLTTGLGFESRDTAILQGINKTLDIIENERPKS